jgi:UDP-N-acetylmuramoyl-L-alanyl-D-glutamate--2,6-diaminopimelate ligase
MAGYFAAKTQLFRGLGGLTKKASAVINIDDPWGMQLAGTNGLHARLLTYGTHPAAHVRAENIDIGSGGTRFSLMSPWGEMEVLLRHPGRYNVLNALAAMSACGVLGVKPELMAAALHDMDVVPGRLEQIPNARGILVFVDYAHTDDALANVLAALRDLGKKRILAVFGCGGDRDRSKRPLMGGVAVRDADYAIITSDNPRSEDPEAIIRDIMSGV